METHVITAHGLTVTQDTINEFGLKPAPTNIKLPPNVIVIANCYNRKTWISPKTMGVIWFFLMHDIHKQLLGLSPKDDALLTKYLTLLAAFSVVNENKMCAYIDQSPNIAFYFKEEAFRTGVYTSPMQLEMNKKNRLNGGHSKQKRSKKLIGGSQEIVNITKTMFANYLIDFDSSHEYTCMTPEELKSQGLTEEDIEPYEQCKALFHDPIQSFTRPSYNARKENGYVYNVKSESPLVFDYQTMNKNAQGIFKGEYLTLEELIAYHAQIDPNYDKMFHVYVMNTCRTSKDKSNAEKNEQNFLANNVNVNVLSQDIITSCELPVDDDIDFNTFQIKNYQHGNQEDMDKTCRVDHNVSKKRMKDKVMIWLKKQSEQVGGKKQIQKTKAVKKCK
jgi:hypothetical protein